MFHRLAASENSRSTSPLPPRHVEAATEYGVKLDGQRAKPPSWCAVRMISHMPRLAEAAIQSSALRAVGLNRSGLRQG
jgi:hypothetical protein